ncbi:MAG: HAMP domain-containing histidine kinase [Mogibacterium sp.]|nr:HAMP domain-containing histidine kinase [Mogibacterium sp.]MBR2540480.1 HAMP domain-containing histidine kinase [Mogibacterium sp.]
MINRLKKKFIVLAMASLIALLAVIVAGMNIINYNAVVSEADETLEMLSSNKGRMPKFFNDGWDNRLQDIYGEDPSASYDDIEAGTGDYGSKPGGGYGHDGFAPKGFSRDEAEETRFFTVLLDSDDSVITVNTDRIYAVDENEAEEYAAEAVASGNTCGFIDDYRYCVKDESDYTRITFMDCGRLLGSFRKFLYASIIMSVIGLAAVFVIICYFAGRIVRPVAESYEKQKRFITDAGHEIKTPLTIIKANIDLMKMDIDDAAEEESADVNALAGTLNESLDDITGQVDRLTTLTNDLVYLSRMEEGSGSLTMTEVPVSDIVSETAGSFEPVAVERKKTISSEIEPMISMQGSTKELEKLVSILMENALKYSPEGDNIGVTLRKEGKNVVLEVRNKSMTPLSDEDLAHVFERFYRTDKSRNSAAGGHGIGLSMASAITAAHGGKIRARSGDGTEFIVTATMPAN